MMLLVGGIRSQTMCIFDSTTIECKHAQSNLLLYDSERLLIQKLAHLTEHSRFGDTLVLVIFHQRTFLLPFFFVFFFFFFVLTKPNNCPKRVKEGPYWYAVQGNTSQTQEHTHKLSFPCKI